MKTFKDTKDCNIMTMERDPKLRKKPEYKTITFVVPKGTVVEAGDVIEEQKVVAPKHFRLKSITEIRPAALSGDDHVTAEME